MELIAFVLPSHMPGYGGWGNGYVAIPKNHPCYGLSYDEIESKYTINVNGGLTYSGKSNMEYHPEETKGMWVVGFDTLHYGDNMEVWPNEESVMGEAERLKDQLSHITK